MTLRMLVLGTLVGCSGRAQVTTGAPGVNERTTVATFIVVGDTYRIGGDRYGRRGGMARLRTLRQRLEDAGESPLLLHAGDLLYPSFLSRSFDGAQMVDALNHLDGSPDAWDERLFVTFGNHEFDRGELKHAPLLSARFAESEFSWLSSNIVWATGDNGQPYLDTSHIREDALVEVGGVSVGLMGLTLPFKTPEYVADYADAVQTARVKAAELRAAGAELVVAITHQDLESDIALLTELGAEGPDLIAGGHEHVRHDRVVGGRHVVKADADAYSAAVVRLTKAGDGWDTRVEFVELQDPEFPEDEVLVDQMRGWNEKQDGLFCLSELGEARGCLNVELTRADTTLVGTESEIRRYETNLGNVVADALLEHWAPEGVQVAFVNSGALRLNRELQEGSRITRREVEELLPFPSHTQRVRIDRATLEAVLMHSVSNWTGHGHWLQVAGVAFRHDPSSSSISDVTLLGPEGPRRMRSGETIDAVTVDYLTTPETGQDGYVMLTPDKLVGEPGAPLKDVLLSALKRAGDGGVSTQVEGRICNAERSGPCLAVDATEDSEVDH